MKRLLRGQGVLVSMVVVVSALAGCGGGRASIIAGETPHADPTTDGHLVGSVIAPPDAAFAVRFQWKEGSPASGGTFVWTQAGGVRRWDFAPAGAADAYIGWFSIERNFDATGFAGSSLDCLWEHTQGPNVRLGCDGVPPSHPGADAFTRSLSRLHLSGRVADRTIAGRTAACYAFPESKGSYGLICVDAADKTPLLFAASGAGRNKAFHEFEATEVLPVPSTVPTPADAPVGTVLSPVTRAAASLSLPADWIVPS